MMISRQYRLVLLVAFVASMVVGCNKDAHPCTIAMDGENYVLSDSALSYINEYGDANGIIFETRTGVEVAFNVAMKDTIVSYQVPSPCEMDSSRNQTIQGTSQIVLITLSNVAVLSESIAINLFEYPKTPDQAAQEALAISLGVYFSNSFEEGDELFSYNLNTSNPHVHVLDSLLIGSRMFYSVYERNDIGNPPKLEIKYTKTEGIVYIKNPLDTQEYIYKRKE
jgi:hypothetical protein